MRHPYPVWMQVYAFNPVANQYQPGKIRSHIWSSPDNLWGYAVEGVGDVHRSWVYIPGLDLTV